MGARNHCSSTRYIPLDRHTHPYMLSVAVISDTPSHCAVHGHAWNVTGIYVYICLCILDSCSCIDEMGLLDHICIHVITYPQTHRYITFIATTFVVVLSSL